MDQRTAAREKQRQMAGIGGLGTDSAGEKQLEKAWIDGLLELAVNFL